ncbi:MAG TPA: ATP-binding cassette domain-containing protein, partial [Flavobacteriales bacterium]|nr:ATP-binding cassette domain-containing protein [Flavobacteriales bacterium]
ARSMGTFKLIGETSLPLDRTDQLVNGYVTARKAHFRVLLGQYGAMVVFKVVVTLSLLALGGVLVMNEQMNLGQFVAAEIVILLLMGAVEKIILRIETVYDVLTALDKVGSVTDLPLEREEGLRTIDRNASKGLDVRLTGVAFRSHFHGRPVLEGIDLHLEPGEKVCLSGPNGAGKTTLLRILGGAITAHEGTVQLDGHPMNSLDLGMVRSVIGDSLTDEDVFAGTVLENIAVGRAWVTEKDVTDACRVTGLFEQLSQYPEGLLTRLDPQGSRLPKSLVKRIIQARCIAGSPRLILLEDSLQNWDMKDREELLGWISAPERPWTLLAVSNDPWLQQRCTRSVHLRDGKLIPA